MNINKLISFVIPIYNEEEGIPQLIKGIAQFIDSYTRYSFEIIFVENGSIDNSFILLNTYAKSDKRFKIIQLSKNVGCDGGIEAGIHSAKGDALVIMMADLQEPIALIKDFIKNWENGYDIVYGIVKKRTSGIFSNIAARLYYKIFNLLTGNIFPENVSDFRLIDKKVYEAIKSMKEQNKYLRGLISWTGFKQIGIPFDRNKRFAGKSKANVITIIKVALNGIFSFSYLPLRFVSFLGIIITTGSSFLIVFYLYLFFVHGREAPGIMTIIMTLLFLFGVLFFILGILSEYLARIYDEVKKRPVFIEKNRINF